MERQKRFAVIGSDARQLAAGRALARAGYVMEGPEEIALADYILLPLPLDAARTPLAELLRAARPGALALGGMLSEEAKAIAAEAGVELVDYFAREELAIRNAIPTAEGCIGVLLAQRKRTLWGSAVLLLGFGPVGQAVGTRLAALGAHVTVAARRPAQRAQAESLGMQGAELARLARLAPAFDTVVNTIPAQVLTAPVLARLRPGSLIVDLASRPGGTDFDAAARCGHKAIHALSLPLPARRKQPGRSWPGRCARCCAKGREHDERETTLCLCGLRQLLHAGDRAGTGTGTDGPGLGAAARHEQYRRPV